MKLKRLLRRRKQIGGYKHLYKGLKEVVEGMLYTVNQMLKHCQSNEVQEAILEGSCLYLNNDYTLKEGQKYTITAYDGSDQEKNTIKAKRREVRKISKFGAYIEKYYDICWTYIEIQNNLKDITIHGYGFSNNQEERLNEHLKFVFDKDTHIKVDL